MTPSAFAVQLRPFVSRPLPWLLAVVLTGWGCGGSEDGGGGEGGQGGVAGAAGSGGGGAGGAGGGSGGEGGTWTATGSVYECGLHAPLGGEDGYLVLESTSPEVQVLLLRRAVGPGPGISTTYALVGFGLRLDQAEPDDVTCSTDASLFGYESTLHNWADEASARVADRRYLVRMRYQPVGDPMSSEWTWQYDVEAFDDAGVGVWGPHPLELVDSDPVVGL